MLLSNWLPIDILAFYLLCNCDKMGLLDCSLTRHLAESGKFVLILPCPMRISVRYCAAVRFITPHCTPSRAPNDSLSPPPHILYLLQTWWKSYSQTVLVFDIFLSTNESCSSFFLSLALLKPHSFFALWSVTVLFFGLSQTKQPCKWMNFNAASLALVFTQVHIWKKKICNVQWLKQCGSITKYGLFSAVRKSSSSSHAEPLPFSWYFTLWFYNT